MKEPFLGEPCPIATWAFSWWTVSHCHFSEHKFVMHCRLPWGESSLRK